MEIEVVGAVVLVLEEGVMVLNCSEYLTAAIVRSIPTIEVSIRLRRDVLILFERFK